jgi:hypothetical protein
VTVVVPASCTRLDALACILIGLQIKELEIVSVDSLQSWSSFAAVASLFSGSNSAAPAQLGTDSVPLVSIQENR